MWPSGKGWFGGGAEEDTCSQVWTVPREDTGCSLSAMTFLAGGDEVLGPDLEQE